MNNFYLLNEALSLNDVDLFRVGMEELFIIDSEKEKSDHFLKHDSIWNIPIWSDFWSIPMCQSLTRIQMFVEQTQSVHHYISNEVCFDKLYPNKNNAFLGIDFTNTPISEEKQIINRDSFASFKTKRLWEVTPTNFWEKRELLFPNLILCGDVQDQIDYIGESDYFRQIINKLKEFNNSVTEWETGDFNHKKINRDYPLVISDESDSTKAKYSAERKFGLPDGRKEYFYLHIKTGDLRFHIYADNAAKKIYVGYIGKHLRTVTG